ncbi:MAG: TPM domain-containing protein [Lachnospiraceae bacterium]|nr:TPM domain-containing protein [Lachnospiraceae bacterium]
MRADKRRTLSRIAAALFIMLHIMVYSSFLVLGADDALYVNSETGYGVYIYDDEDLLTDEEEDELLQNMIPLTTYGGAAFVSTSSQDAEATVRSESHSIFNNASSTLFLIDMGAREIKLANTGDVHKAVTDNYMNIITDNAYTYASGGDYLACAQSVFDQEYSVLEGHRIAQPMRYLTNILTAIVAGLLINFIFVWVRKGKVTISDSELIAAAAGAAIGTAISKHRVSSRKTRIVSSSGSSGGGGGFSGGGGGGGFSGGTGGHKF